MNKPKIPSHFSELTFSELNNISGGNWLIDFIRNFTPNDKKKNRVIIHHKIK